MTKKTKWCITALCIIIAISIVIGYVYISHQPITLGPGDFPEPDPYTQNANALTLWGKIIL